MKKILAMACCFLLIGSLAACAANTPNTNNVGAAKPSAVSDEVLEALGMSAEEFAAMPAEQQQAILDEIGAKQNAQQEEQTPAPTNAEKPADPTASGNYVVVLGDYMNSITLYYENGVLVKIVESFQKNSEEEAEYAEYTGDALAEYSFNFIDWNNASLQDILDGMANYGGFGQYVIRPAE